MNDEDCQGVDLIAEMVKSSPNDELLQMKERLMDAIALDPSHDTVGGMLDWMCEIDDELEWRWSFEPPSPDDTT